MKAVFECLSPPGAQARLSILIFHRVHAVADPLFPDEPDAIRFDEVCGWIKSWFRVVPLEQAVAALETGTLPARALAITFDDGYADNHDVALPILQRHGLPATVFVASGFVGDGCMWNDTVIAAVRGCERDVFTLDALGGEPVTAVTPTQRRALIERLLGALKHLAPAERTAAVQHLARQCGLSRQPRPMMSADQVRALHRAGVRVGAHTVTHPILSVLDDAGARAEIAGSRQALESLLDAPVTLFAYPNGRPHQDYDARSVQFAREAGFTAAVSTAWGAARTGRADRFQLPRFTPWDRSRWRFAARLAQNLRLQERRV
jgi:peptidoglycan/xylan/chitin deacetylase (PgdA/CDA1 family)